MSDQCAPASRATLRLSRMAKLDEFAARRRSRARGATGGCPQRRHRKRRRGRSCARPPQAADRSAALLEQSHREGLELGHAEGLAEMREAAAALREALAQFDLQRHQIVAEAEGFCVDIALAIVARLVATDSARTEFVVSSVKSALKTLAPENPTAVYLHPKGSQTRSACDRRASPGRRRKSRQRQRARRGGPAAGAELHR